MSFRERIQKIAYPDFETKRKRFRQLLNVGNVAVLEMTPDLQRIVCGLDSHSRRKVCIVSRGKLIGRTQRLAYIITDGCPDKTDVPGAGTAGRRIDLSFLNRVFVGQDQLDSVLKCASLVGLKPIILYQMGKVGSSSILMSLAKLRLGRPIWYVTTLSGALIHPVLSSRFASIEQAPLKLITGTREPLGSNVSEFFEQLDYSMPDFKERIASGRARLEDLGNVFFRTFPHERPLVWFDDEFLPNTGIDVYQQSWLQYISGRGIDVLVSRLEDLALESTSRVFNDFLGTEDFTVVRENIGSDKPYSGLYRQFINNVTFPERYVEWLYCSRYANHFYRPHELVLYRQKWKIGPDRAWRGSK